MHFPCRKGTKVEKFLAGLLAAMLVASAGRCWAGDKPPHKPISEHAVRTASARLYSHLLALECMHPRRYPRSRIENGFERHFEETRRTFVAEGYTIVPDATDALPSQMAFDARRRLGIPPQSGCHRAYWLYD